MLTGSLTKEMQLGEPSELAKTALKELQLRKLN